MKKKVPNFEGGKMSRWSLWIIILIISLVIIHFHVARPWGESKHANPMRLVKYLGEYKPLSPECTLNLTIYIAGDYKGGILYVGSSCIGHAEFRMKDINKGWRKDRWRVLPVRQEFDGRVLKKYVNGKHENRLAARIDFSKFPIIEFSYNEKGMPKKTYRFEFFGYDITYLEGHPLGHHQNTSGAQDYFPKTVCDEGMSVAAYDGSSNEEKRINCYYKMSLGVIPDKEDMQYWLDLRSKGMKWTFMKKIFFQIGNISDESQDEYKGPQGLGGTIIF